MPPPTEDIGIFKIILQTFFNNLIKGFKKGLRLHLITTVVFFLIGFIPTILLMKNYWDRIDKLAPIFSLAGIFIGTVMGGQLSSVFSEQKKIIQLTTVQESIENLPDNAPASTITTFLDFVKEIFKK